MTTEEETNGEDARFKTLRHMETVRNHLNTCINALMRRGEQHDQTKLQSPEVAGFAKVTPQLRGMTYGSDEYHAKLKEMKPFLDHHYAHNRHHPEYHKEGINDMTLIDLVEMLCDWKSSTMRHNDGNILKSIEINTKRFHIDAQLSRILMNTALWLLDQEIFHHAEES